MAVCSNACAAVSRAAAGQRNMRTTLAIRMRPLEGTTLHLLLVAGDLLARVATTGSSLRRSVELLRCRRGWSGHLSERGMRMVGRVGSRGPPSARCSRRWRFRWRRPRPAVRRDVIEPEVAMRPTVRWLGRMLYGGAIVGALAFGAQQAVATMHVQDPCECPTVGSYDECYDCCGYPDGGFCATIHYCICL
jgi:hypothetical protein